MDKTVPTPAGTLLDFIGQVETGSGDYDTIYGHNQDKLTKPITEMTLNELMENQKGFTKAFGSSASGKYQFMKATLEDLQRELGLRGTQIMDPNLQDRLGYHLLRRRGYDRWVEEKIDDEDFMIGLAKEWASFPVPYDMQGHKRKVKKGQSYYAGDGVNKALIGVDEVKEKLKEARKIIQSEPTEVEPETPPVAVLNSTITITLENGVVTKVVQS
jgi:muramidase (phage lysozyme)